MRSLIALAVCASAFLIPSQGTASILFDNGPDAGITSPDISTAGYSGVAFFDFQEDVVVDSISFYDWVNHDDQATTVDWAIENAAGDTVLYGGTSAALANVFVDSVRAGAYDVYRSTFAVSDLAFSAGNYRLLLANCLPTNAGCGWGVADQVGSDYQIQPGNVTSPQGSLAFSLSGYIPQDADTGAEAPEPGTIMMFVPALAGLAAVIRRRRA